MRKLFSWIFVNAVHICWAILYACLVIYFFNSFVSRKARNSYRQGDTVSAVECSAATTLSAAYRPGC